MPECSIFNHAVDERPPRHGARSQLAAVLARGLFQVAGPAKGLEPVHVPWVLPWLALQRRDVIAFEPPRPAAHKAPPAVTVEHGAAHGLPAPLIEARMVTAHRAITWRRGRRCGAFLAREPSATAMIAAAAASSRARARRPPSLDFASLAFALGSMTTLASDIA